MYVSICIAYDDNFLLKMRKELKNWDINDVSFALVSACWVLYSQAIFPLGLVK